MSGGAPEDFLAARRAALTVAAAALLLRLPWLGRLGLFGDEDVSTLAARGVWETGWLQLPAGGTYWRAPLYHYLIAPLTAFEIDWLPRLLSVAASVVTAYLLVRLARRWVGGPVAFVGGLIFAVSLLEIDFARQIRMYSLYQLVALLAVAAAFLAWSESRWPWVILTVLAPLLAVQAHMLGATLAALTVLVAVRARTFTMRALCIAALVAVAVLLPPLRSLIYVAQLGGLSPVVEGAAVDAPARDLFGLDPLAFGQNLLGAVPFGGFVLLLAAVGAVLSLTASGGLSPWRRAVAAAGLAAVTGLAAAHQIGLAGVASLLLLLQRDELYPGDRGRRVLIAAAGAVAVLAAVWGLAGVLSGVNPRHLVIGLFGRLLGRFVRLLLSGPVAVTLFALAGSVMILIRSWTGTARQGERFVLTVVLGLTAARSVVAGKSQERYLADLWPLWGLLAAGAIVAVVVWAGGRWQQPPRRRMAMVAAAVVCGLIFVVAPGTAPATTLAYLSRGPGEPPDGTDAVAEFVPDFRGVAAWLETRRRPGDRLVATDWLSAACYFGPVDGWIRYSNYGHQSVEMNGVARDAYLHAEVLSGRDALADFVARGPTWVVAGGNEWTDEVKLDAATRAWLEGHEPVFRAADGVTRVYAFSGAGAGAGAGD